MYTVQALKVVEEKHESIEVKKTYIRILMDLIRV